MSENLKNIIVWSVLVTAIVYVQFQKLLKKFFSDGKNENKAAKHEDFLVVNLCYIVAAGCAVYLLYNLTKTSKEFAKKQKEEPKEASPNKLKYYAEMCSKQEYTAKKSETTQKELDKLYSTAKFQQMYKERGDNQEEWCWQTKQKYSPQKEEFVISDDNLTDI